MLFPTRRPAAAPPPTVAQQPVHKSTTDIPGVSRTHARIVPFVARQWLDVFAPSNHPMTDPEILRPAVASQGMNFMRGAENWMQDVLRYLAGQPAPGAEQYRIGRGAAATAGQIIVRNELMELIQHGPTTATVVAEPVLCNRAYGARNANVSSKHPCSAGNRSALSCVYGKGGEPVFSFLSHPLFQVADA
ncbi:hypothetical protein FHW79_002518 [Azospirillum sp. OGB3]|uniref:hypothetical protein n=1 Tax=Azospirillum sp. OGB3 TaxID=2587012 RepID=UPI001606F017|nr:hypothetical protein [Azospirillum sp. OGB3]